MPPNCGFSITAQKRDSKQLGLFISGLSWESGKFRTIIPLRPGDFVPVWETAEDAGAVLESAGMDAWEFRVVDIGFTYRAPADKPAHLFRGVAGFTLPVLPSNIPMGGRS